MSPVGEVDKVSSWRLIDLESYPPFVKLGRY